jgi:hypothetical protein
VWIPKIRFLVPYFLHNIMKRSSPAFSRKKCHYYAVLAVVMEVGLLS